MKTLLSTLLLILSVQLFAGGPWLLPKKSGFFQLQTTVPAGSYVGLFRADGESLILNRSVVDINLQAYLEYGLTDNLDVLAVLPYKFISTGDTTGLGTIPELLERGSLNGFSNPRLGFKYKAVSYTHLTLPTICSV